MARVQRLWTLWPLAAILLCLVISRTGLAQQPPPAPQLTAEDAKAKETFVRVCTKCHPAEIVTAEGRSRSQWENTIVAMQTSRQAVVTNEEFGIIVDYLAKFHDRGSGGTPAAPGAGRGPRANVGAADRHRVDPAGALRGQKVYAAECVTCHGASARGTERGPNLIRSPRMLRDRSGSAIGPLLKAGHPMQTGSAASLTNEQITDISHFVWDRINNTLRGAPEFDVKGVLTGDPAAGRTYFNGAGGCAKCHSPTGDLVGYGKRYPPVDIQQRFVFPPTGGGRGRGANPRTQVMVTVTPPNGTPVTGALVSMDDFNVTLREATGENRSWPRTPDMKVVKTDPMAAHVALLDRLTDKAMHDVTAYLETLK